MNLLPERFSRHRVWVCLCVLWGHALLTVGYAVPVAAGPAAGLPYPCAMRACGCRSSAECWQGDCCCFTLAEKVAWAEAHAVALPDDIYQHLTELTTTRKPVSPVKACCAPAKKSTCCQDSCCHVDEPTCAACPHEEATEVKSKWILELTERQCRGQGLKGWFLVEPVNPLAEMACGAWPQAVAMLPHGWAVHHDNHISLIDTPPPRRVWSPILGV